MVAVSLKKKKNFFFFFFFFSFFFFFFIFFFFQAEDGIRDLVRSRGLGDVYKRQAVTNYLALRLVEIIKGEAAKEELKYGTQHIAVELSLIHI